MVSVRALVVVCGVVLSGGLTPGCIGVLACRAVAGWWSRCWESLARVPLAS